ncbi:MAG: hypothetical protein V4459_04225 [Pseudomonadota bacterium]
MSIQFTRNRLYRSSLDDQTSGLPFGKAILMSVSGKPRVRNKATAWTTGCSKSRDNWRRPLAGRHLGKAGL